MATSAPRAAATVAVHDPIWRALRVDAETLVQKEPAMAGMVYAAVLSQPTLEDALSARIAKKLSNPDVSAAALLDVAREAYDSDPSVGVKGRADLAAVYERDPACVSYLQPLLYFKGFIALQSYRVTHWLWNQGRKDFAQFMQMRISERFGVDIHPAARIGKGMMIDHATGVVIGETAAVGDNVSMLHGVTLGGNGKESGDRHPKVGDGVLLGANASILGNIPIGHCSRVGAGSVVLHPVPPCKTVAGVPAKVVGNAGCDHPSVRMDHVLPE